MRSERWLWSLFVIAIMSLAVSVAYAGDKKLYIESSPEGAQVDVNGNITCTTPCVLNVSGAYFGAKHTAFSGRVDQPLSIRLIKEGFLPKDALLTTGPHTWRSINGENTFEYYLIDSDHFNFRLDPVQSFVGQAPQVDINDTQSSTMQPEPGSQESIVQKSLPAIVQVETSLGSGSGFFISSEGLLATNAHVVRDQPSATIITSSGKAITSSHIYVDEDRDLALIKVEAHDVPFLVLSPTLPLQGADVIAIGTPGAHDASGIVMLPNSVTKGIVSGIREFSDTTIANIPGRAGIWIQTDATINHGNSGGPLLNRSGLVVGINTLSFSATGTPGINFALASTELAQVVNYRLGVNLNSPAPPQSQLSSSSAKLTITSTPTGADIEVDGAFLGSTPSDISVASGSRTIKISKKGYIAYQRTIQAQPGGSQRIAADLEAIGPTP